MKIQTHLYSCFPGTCKINDAFPPRALLRLVCTVELAGLLQLQHTGEYECKSASLASRISTRDEGRDSFVGLVSLNPWGYSYIFPNRV